MTGRWAILTVVALMSLSAASQIRPNLALVSQPYHALNPILMQGPISGPVSYVYDELGRLVAAIDAAGNAAVYTYDVVGNILSIQRYSSTDLAIISFSPDHGPSGTTITITGTGFSPTANQNSVEFNGTSSTVISSTTNQIVTTVPVGATSGQITVVSPLGSTVSAKSFTVTTSNGVPRIDSFSPQIVAPGTAVNITGANFDASPPNDHLMLNVTGGLIPSAATTTSMTLATPASTGSGHISVSTPQGTATSAGDLFVPPSPFTPAQVGYTGRANFGVATTVSIATANKIGLLLFDGTAGHSVSVTTSSPSFSSCSFQIYKPDNTALSASTASCSAVSLLDSQKLPMSGTYAVLINASAGSAGGAIFTIFDSTEITGTLVPGGPPFTITTTVPGQNARLTFVGNTHVSISLSNSTFTSCGITVYNPDTTALASSLGCTSSTTYDEVPYLPEAGTYTIFVDPGGSQTGTVTIKLNDATDITGPIATDGTASTVTTSAPGQNAKLTFSGSPGQRITAILDTNTYTSQVSLSIVAPSGSQVAGASAAATGTLFLDDTQYCSPSYVCGSITLPTTGTYTLFLDPSGTGTGHARLRLFNVPNDATFSSSLGGTQIPVAITTPGQNGKITFSGTQGQRLSLGFVNANFSGGVSPSISYELLKPDGTLFAGPSNGGPFNFPTSTTSGLVDWNDIFTFPSTGTYTVVLDPLGDATGSVNINLYNATDLSLSVATDGTVNSVATTSAGQNAHLNFTPSIGQRVSALVTNISYQGQQPSVILRRVDAGGNVTNLQFASTDGSNLFVEPFTISQSGSYFIFMDPSGQTVGSANVALYTVNDLSGTMDTAGTQITIATTIPGQNASYTFSGTSGQTLTWAVNGVTYPVNACQIRIVQPNASVLGARDCFGTTGSWSQNFSLTQTGTYTLVVDPVKSTTGSMNVSLTAQ